MNLPVLPASTKPTHQNLPEWMLQGQVRMERAGTTECSSKLSRFPRAGVHSALVAIQQTLLQEKTAAKQGLIQSLDPRLKLLASLTLLVMISLLSNVSLLCLIAAFLFTLAVISHIDSLYFAKRVWLAAPL